MSQDGREGIRCPPGDDVPVAVTHAARGEADLDLAGTGRVELDVFEIEGGLDLAEHGGTHAPILWLDA